MAASTELREGTRADLPALTDLYNHYIRTSACTFDLEPFESRNEWFQAFGVSDRHQLVVATRNQMLIGYACSTAFRQKAAYASSAEVSVYVAPNCHQAGLGTQLYTALFDRLQGTGIHQLYAGITIPNDASVHLHERLGFRHCGTFPDAGYKFDQFWDVAWYARPISPA